MSLVVDGHDHAVEDNRKTVPIFNIRDYPFWEVMKPDRIGGQGVGLPVELFADSRYTPVSNSLVTQMAGDLFERKKSGLARLHRWMWAQRSAWQPSATASLSTNM